MGTFPSRRLSKIAHSEPAVGMLPIRNRVGGEDRSWHISEEPTRLETFRLLGGERTFLALKADKAARL